MVFIIINLEATSIVMGTPCGKKKKQKKKKKKKPGSFTIKKKIVSRLRISDVN